MVMTAERIVNTGLYEAAVELMDGQIREEVHKDLAPCTEYEFLSEYMRRHEEKYGEPFVVN